MAVLWGCILKDVIYSIFSFRNMDLFNTQIVLYTRRYSKRDSITNLFSHWQLSCNFNWRIVFTREQGILSIKNDDYYVFIWNVWKNLRAIAYINEDNKGWNTEIYIKND